MKWIVREKVGQEYTWEIEAETAEEATHKIERGEGGTCLDTQELRPQYFTHPKGYPHSLPVTA